MLRWLKLRFLSDNFSTPKGSEAAGVSDLAVSAEHTVIYARIQKLEAEDQNEPPPSALSDTAGLSSLVDNRLSQPGFRRRLDRQIRLSRRFSDMRIFEAKLIFAIHRGSLRRIAQESTVALHRDLMRFILSSRGNAILKDRQPPSKERIRKWIHEAKKITQEPLRNEKGRPKTLAR